MNLNVSFDQSLSSLPASFVSAVNYVVNYFDTLFTNNITINIDLGYGEIDGQHLAGNDLGESEANLASIPYQEAVRALEIAGLAGSSTLSGNSPFANGTLWVTTAQERAIGLLSGNSAEIDGWVGISNTAPFSYLANTTPAAGQYYLIGVLEHEFTEIMGRMSFLGADIGGTRSYSIMDLYRFSSPGVHQLGTASPAYFSIDNGNTNFDNWNTNPGGDLGDWAASAGPDAFLAFSTPGQIESLSAADLTLMNAIGWSTSNSTSSDTTIPAVAVEASMYGAVGTQVEVNALATQFLPAQVANAIHNGLNPEVYACEALGLAFAFSNESGSSAFANNYGPGNPSMPNSAAGDAAFATAAASTIFVSAVTANLTSAIDAFVTNWKSFFSAHGILEISNPSPTQIDLAARGAAWGDAVGIALTNNIGPLLSEIMNFLNQAAQGTAVYSAPLSAKATDAGVQIVGLAQHVEHVVV